VSRLWAEEGAKQLRKRAWVHFDFYGGTFDNDLTIGMKTFRYDYDVKNSTSGFSLSNTVLSLPNYDPSQINKLMKDLDWFFTQNYHRFKKTKLDMRVYRKMDFDNVVKVLTIISPFMAELEFTGPWRIFDGHDVQFECKFPSDDYFSKIKKVSVSDYGYVSMWNGFKTLISAMKMNNVKEIDLFSCSDFERHWDCLDCLHQSGNSHGKQISVSLTGNEQEKSFAGLLSSKFNQPLNKLIIKYDSLHESNIPIFQSVLFKHCKTLEVLSFQMPFLYTEWKLQFPIFQKLKILDINFDNYDYSMHKDIHVMFDDGTGNEMELNYNRHFPNLQSLTLLPLYFKKKTSDIITKHWKKYYKIFKVFFSFLPSTHEELEYEHNEEKSFKNLVYLDIPFEESCPERMEMIARNFPNVHNPWLNKIRQKMTDNDSSQTANTSSVFNDKKEQITKKQSSENDSSAIYKNKLRPRHHR
jgi:hypothetical protein